MWPDGFHCACSLTFDLDAESAWIANDAKNITRPGVLALGRYGPRVAVPLILSLLEWHGVTATFFIPGKVAEDYPERVKEIVNAGHEIAAHGYTHDSPCDFAYEQEEEQLLRSKSILENMGNKVVGYRAPTWDLSQNTLPLLQKHGFIYSSNMMDDVKPYRHPETGLIELPIQWIMDDWVHFGFGPGDWTKRISTNSDVREIWELELEGICKLGGVFIPTMHPQIIGRPSRLKMLDEFIEFVKSHEGVWIATCAQIADQVKDKL